MVLEAVLAVGYLPLCLERKVFDLYKSNRFTRHKYAHLSCDRLVHPMVQEALGGASKTFWISSPHGELMKVEC